MKGRNIFPRASVDNVVREHGMVLDRIPEVVILQTTNTTIPFPQQPREFPLNYRYCINPLEELNAYCLCVLCYLLTTVRQSE